MATKTSPFPESYARPCGPLPPLTVETTVLLASDMTEIVLESELLTNISPLPES